MDKNILKSVVIEQNSNLQRSAQYVIRDRADELEKYAKLTHAIVITGIRRCGKSTLLLQTVQADKKRNFYYLNFEDERLLNFTADDFNDLYEVFLELYGEQKIVYFDEIQNIPGWEAFVRRMMRDGIKFYLTGSNASLLSKEIGTKLTGRHVTLNLFPFSFAEFLSSKNVDVKKDDFFETRKKARIKKLFLEYLEKGGMPEYVRTNEDKIIKDVYEDVLYRDILVRYEIKEVKALRELALYCFTNAASLISYNKIKTLLKLGSVNTVKSYIDYLENSFLLFPVNIFSYSLKQQYIAPKKIYTIDNGFLRNIAFNFMATDGKYLENLVFVELKRRGREIFYYKTAKNLEVDFLCRQGAKVSALIQVTWSMTDESTRKRETQALFGAMTELKIKEGLIITYDDKEELIKETGIVIKVVPVYKWILRMSHD